MGCPSITGYVSQEEVKQKELEYTIERITIANFEKILDELDAVREMGRYENYFIDENDNLMPMTAKNGDVFYPVIGEKVDVHEDDYNPIDIYYANKEGKRVPAPICYCKTVPFKYNNSDVWATTTQYFETFYVKDAKGNTLEKRKPCDKNFSADYFDKYIKSSFEKYQVIFKANDYKKNYHFQFEKQPKNAKIRLIKHTNFLKRKKFDKNKILYIYKIQLDVLIDIRKNQKSKPDNRGYLMSKDEFANLPNDAQKRLSRGFQDNNQKHNFQDNHNHFNNNLNAIYE